jgi:hypothetical protein
MTKYSDIFSRALLQHAASTYSSVLVLGLMLVNQNGTQEVYTFPMPSSELVWNARASAATHTSAEALRATIKSTKADKVILMVNVEHEEGTRHQHVLVVTVSQGSCIHFDPHGSIAEETSAKALEAWFCETVSQSWTQPIQFQSVQSWCNIEGPQAKLCNEDTVESGCNTLSADLNEYLLGSCVVWSFWFACQLLCHAELTPIEVLDRFYQELDHREWTVTMFLKHYLNDIVAYLRPYVMHNHVEGLYCIGSKALGFWVDCSYVDDGRFEMLKLILAANKVDETL